MKPLRILVVDDLPTNVKLLRAQLEAEGHFVAIAFNGLEALEVLEREQIDVIISDVLMPEMDGYQFCYRVRRDERFCDLPFIFHAATFTSRVDEQLAFNLGADAYLRKPTSVKDMLFTIDQAISRSRRPRPLITPPGEEKLQRYSKELVTTLQEKNIETMAAASQLSLQTLALETAADAILITDVQGVILWVNPAFTTITGYRMEEAIGKSTRILKSGIHDEAFYRQFWETINSGRVWQGEFTNRRKDGTIYYALHTVRSARGLDGTISHFVGVLHDITGRKRAEGELRDAHAQLRQLLEHSPAVIYALTIDGEKIIPRLASENINELLGFTVAETLSFEWWLSRLHPDDLELATASLRQTLALGENCSEYRLRHKDDSYRWVEDNRRLVRDARGEPAEFVGVWTDITERHEAQDELRVHERRLSDMLENLQLLSRMLDRDARITYCNDYLLQLTGWKREELLGQDWFGVFPEPELHGNAREAFSVLLPDAPDSWSHESVILTRSGERRIVRWHNSLMRSTSGEVIGTASVGEDITDRKNHELQFLRAQRLESLGTLAGGIAHDLNNLFMPILMGVTLIKRFDPPEKTRKAIENIERCVKRGTDLVKQVLLFARGVEGARRVAVDVASVAAEVEAIARSTFPKNVTFATSIARNLPLLLGDPTQLTQVLLNLCVNSRDAMPAGGKITLSAGHTEIEEQFAAAHGGSRGGRYVVLEVADNGAGISPKDIDRIFEPFFTTKEVGLGTGLGLSTSLGIVRSHGGFMTVSSEASGTTFRAFLPLQSDGAPSAAIIEQTDQELPRGNGELILVVDDEQAILDITRQALEASNYEVVTAEDGAQALDLYVRNQSKVALVLTDMMMPIVDGATLIRALRRINPEVRIIAVSGEDGPLQAIRAGNAGTPYFLVKPFTVEIMLRTVTDVLRDRTPASSP